MADVFYPGTLASDPGTVGRSPLPNAVFQVFELTDTAHVNPLPLKDSSGLSITSLASTSLGVLPGVYVTSPNLSHNWVSGTWVWRRDSFDGAQAAVTAAKNASISGASLSPAGDLTFTTLGGTVIPAGNVKGPQGNPGVNTLPTDTAVAGLLNDSSSATRAAGNATYVPAAGFDTWSNTTGSSWWSALVAKLKSLFAPKRHFYPEDYGADPTGAANSTPAIQSAVDAANAAGGGVVIIGGTYRVDTSITPRNNVTLQGLGWGKSQLVASASWPDGASITQLGGSTANPLLNWTSRDIKYDMTNVPVTNKGKALFVTYSRNLRFENNWVLNTTATGIGADFIDAGIIRGNRVEGCGRFAAGSEETILGCSGIGIGTGAWGSEATLVENNFIINAQRYGIFTEYQSGISTAFTFGVKILNNYIVGAYRGIGSDGVAYDHIIGNHVEGSRQDGIVIAPGNAGAASYGTTVAQNTVRTSARYGMLVDFSWAGNGAPPEAGKFMITENQLVLNTGVGLKVITSGQLKGFQVVNNRISENGSIGVDITGGGLLESDIIDNRVTDNTGVGIRILGNCLRIRIRGNRSGDTRATGRTQVSGLQLSSAITDSIVEGNDFRNTTGTALDQPTAPVTSIIRNNPGYNPIGTDTLAVTASPMTYTVGTSPENLYIIGGTWTSVSLNGVNMATSNPSVIMAQPNDTVVFTYTAAPTAIKRHRL